MSVWSKHLDLIRWTIDETDVYIRRREALGFPVDKDVEARDCLAKYYDFLCRGDYLHEI